MPKAKTRLGFRMMFIKTLTNSWSTSNRYHNIIRLPCILGCGDCHDVLDHYLFCDTLWTIACTALGLDQGWLGLTFPQRLGYLVPNLVHFQLNAIMFKVYHALRNDFSNVVNLSINDGDFSDLQSRAWPITSPLNCNDGVV